MSLFRKRDFGRHEDRQSACFCKVIAELIVAEFSRQIFGRVVQGIFHVESQSILQQVVDDGSHEMFVAMLDGVVQRARARLVTSKNFEITRIGAEQVESFVCTVQIGRPVEEILVVGVDIVYIELATRDEKLKELKSFSVQCCIGRLLFEKMDEKILTAIVLYANVVPVLNEGHDAMQLVVFNSLDEESFVSEGHDGSCCSLRRGSRMNPVGRVQSAEGANDLLVSIRIDWDLMLLLLLLSVDAKHERREGK